MAGIGDVQLAVNADMTKFEGQVTKGAAQAGDKASGQFSKSFTKKLGSSDLLKGFVTGLGAGGALGAANALATGVHELTDAIFDSIDAASDQREAMSLGAQVFETNEKQIEKWADTAASAFGQSKTEAINFAASFGTAFKNVGFSLDETTEKSKELTHLAADLGSAFNAGSDEAALALRSGLLGESEPLRRFGVFLSEAAVDAELMRKGQKKVNGEWTNGQKVLARYAIIMRQTADSQGMFGRDSESLADTQKALNAEIENVQAEIGRNLIPVMKGLADLARDDLVPALRNVVTVMDALGAAQGKIPKETDRVVDLHQRLIDLLRALPAAQNPVIQGWLDEQQSLNDAATASDRFINNSLGAADRPANEAAIAFRKVAGSVDDIDDNAKKARKSIQDLVKELVDRANDLIARYYDPIEMREKIAQNNADITAAKRILASKNASAQEIRDANNTITSAQRSNDELSVALLATGKMSKKEHDALIKDLDKRIKTASGSTRGYLKLLRAEIARLDGMTATVNIDITQRIRKLYNRENKAVGGPVSAHKPYLVGEIGPELFVPDSYGQIVTAKETEKIMSGASGGGDTYNVTLLDRMEARSVRDIGDGLRILGERGYIGRNRWRRR